MIAPIVWFAVIAALVGGVVGAARRFARQRQREGAWDKNGPIDPTLPPPEFLRVHPAPWGISRPVIVTEEGDDPTAPFDAAVFSSSVLGYTATVARLSAGDGVELVNRIHTTITDAVLAEGGVPVKYIGDGFLAYFKGDDCERRALRAALAARRDLQEQLVVGIARGTIVRADIGHAAHARPDIVGSTVNASFRVQDWAARSTESHIAILGEDAGDLDDEFTMREMDWVQLKGLPETVTIFEVESARS